MAGQIDSSAAQATSRVSAAAFAAKYKSKREVYMFLTVDRKAYLPSFETLTIYFLKDLVSGKKKSKFPQILVHYFVTLSRQRRFTSAPFSSSL